MPSRDYCMATEASQKAESHLGLYSPASGRKHQSYPGPGEDGGEYRLCLKSLPPHTIASTTIHSHSTCQKEAGERGTVGRSPGKRTCRILTDFQFIQNSFCPPSKHWNQNYYTVLKTFENILSALKSKTKQTLKVSNPQKTEQVKRNLQDEQ